MLTERPARLVDPVCEMSVDVGRAEREGLLLELDGRTFAFCSPACRAKFVTAPTRYIAAITSSVAEASHVVAGEAPVIDEGIRRWYESCSCCLSEVYPEIKAQLDAERAAAARPPVDAGICEIAEGTPAAAPSATEREAAHTH